MQIKGVTISKKLSEWIKKRVYYHDEPNTFLIRGYGVLNLTAQQVAENTMKELLAWVRRHDGDFELIDNTYPRELLQRNGYLKVKIYSPVCESVVEKILDDRKENNLRLAQERVSRWRWS